jgi:hypothetical protein
MDLGRQKRVKETKNEVDTALIRHNMVKESPETFGEIHNLEGKIVPTARIKRSNEYSGAGIEYLTDLVDFICSASKIKAAVNDDNRFYYTSPAFSWSMALDIMTGGIAGQRKRVEKEIMRYLERPKMALCQCVDGSYISAWPFVVTFNWGTLENLDAKAVAKLARLNNNGKNEEVLPISTVTVMFLKPLFEAFFQDKPSTYSFPSAMYAKIYKASTDSGLGEDASEVSATANTRLARYLIRHNNLTGRERPDPNGNIGHITLNVRQLLKSTNPPLVHKNGHGNAIINWNEFKQFVETAEKIFWQIADFICYPVFSDCDCGQETVLVNLYKTGSAAKKAGAGL